MVIVRQRRGGNGNRGRRTRRNSSADSNGNLKWKVLFKAMRLKKLDTIVWASRFVTAISVILFMVPVLGDPENFYFKSLWFNTLTYTIRLLQRFPENVQLDRYFLIRILEEDSSHYLFHSLIFIYHCVPMQIAVLSVLIFAILHSAKFSLMLLDVLSGDSSGKMRSVLSFISSQTEILLRTAALAEILTILGVIIFTYADRAFCLAPVMYFRFLTLRFCSRRNPYVKSMLLDTRKFLERVAMSRKCPVILANGISVLISVAVHLAPEIPSYPNN